MVYETDKLFFYLYPANEKKDRNDFILQPASIKKKKKKKNFALLRFF